MADFFYGITDIGRQRDNNEDAFIAQPLYKNGPVLAAVIDGVGGYEGGEVAAAIAKQTFLGAFRPDAGNIIETLRSAYAAANEKIFQEKRTSGANGNMSCVATFSYVDIKNNKFFYAHVGDTRLYLFRDQSLIKVTKDQSFVGFLEDSGRLTEAEAMGHVKRNEINRALGFDIAANFAGDYVETGESPFLPGDTLLLCSDGLTDLVNADGIRSVLSKKILLEEKAKELVDAANGAGGKDNITVVLVQNAKKPVKQEIQRPTVLKKPLAVKKLAEGPAKEAPTPPARIAPAAPQQKNTSSQRNWLIGLSILSFLLLATLIWALTRKNAPEVATTRPEAVQKNPSEIRLQAFINSGTSDTVDISDATIGASIYLTDTLWIRRDSLYLKGSDNATLIRHSAHGNGPAIVVTPQCRFLLIDSLQLKDFGVGILTTNHTVLQFKNARFSNCPVAVAYKPQPDTMALNGSFLNTSVSPKTRNEE